MHDIDLLRTLGVDPAHIRITVNGQPVTSVVSFTDTAVVREIWPNIGRLNDRPVPVMSPGHGFREEEIPGAVAVFLTRAPDNSWPHSAPEPEGDELPL